MLKNIFYCTFFFFLYNISFSQAIIQGYSMMYGGAKYKKSETLPDEDTSKYSIFYSPINDVQGSFSSFNLDYFIKLRWKKNLYLKSNVGFCNYSSKTRLFTDYNTFPSSEWNYEFTKGNDHKVSNAGILLGAGLDYKIKNFSMGLNFQYMLFRLWRSGRVKGKDIEDFETQNWDVDPVYSTVVFYNNSTISIDLEYTLKRFGFKYSYLMASDRPINQFGITYNLKYDWREVPQ